MPSKRQRAKQTDARAASVECFKKTRLEASSLLNSEQLNTDDDKLSTIDTSDNESDSAGTWFWNESANETDSDSEEEGDDDDDEDLEEEQPKMEQAISPKNSKIKLRWNRKGEQNLGGGYGKGSRSTQMLHNKSARELRKEASLTYNIQALWQRSQDLGMISQANSHLIERLAQLIIKLQTKMKFVKWDVEGLLCGFLWLKLLFLSLAPSIFG